MAPLEVEPAPPWRRNLQGGHESLDFSFKIALAAGLKVEPAKVRGGDCKSKR